MKFNIQNRYDLVQKINAKYEIFTKQKSKRIFIRFLCAKFQQQNGDISSAR